MTTTPAFDCELCRALAVQIHAAHQNPEFRIGQAHAKCPEVMRFFRYIQKLNQQILDHAERCKRVKP